jgi:hypothetical protein
VAQVVEHLPSKCKALNPGTTKRKKKVKRKRNEHLFVYLTLCASVLFMQLFLSGLPIISKSLKEQKCLSMDEWIKGSTFTQWHTTLKGKGTSY